MRPLYTHQVRDITYNEIRYNGEECLLSTPKNYMLSNFWQRVSRMGLSTSLVFDRKYMKIVKGINPLNKIESYGWGICIPMIAASEGNVYLTKDIWVKMVNASNSWASIMIDAFTGSALSLLKLDGWYTEEEIQLMFKVYEENVGIWKMYKKELGFPDLNKNADYFRCYKMTLKCNPSYSELDNDTNTI